MLKDLAPTADAEFLHSEEFPTVKNFRDRIDPFKHYTDAEFKLRYRFAKETVRVLIDLLDEKLRPQTNRAHAVSTATQVRIPKFYFGNYVRDHTLPG